MARELRCASHSEATSDRCVFCEIERLQAIAHEAWLVALACQFAPQIDSQKLYDLCVEYGMSPLASDIDIGEQMSDEYVEAETAHMRGRESTLGPLPTKDSDPLLPPVEHNDGKSCLQRMTDGFFTSPDDACDAEIERIMAMSGPEIWAELRRLGHDPDEVVERVRLVIRNAIDQKATQGPYDKPCQLCDNTGVLLEKNSDR